MKTKLTALDRIMLTQIIPQNGLNMIEAMATKQLMDKIMIKPHEFKIYGIQVEGSRMSWDPEKMQRDIEIDLDDTELQLLKDAVKNRDAAKKITLEMVDTCVKIHNL